MSLGIDMGTSGVKSGLLNLSSMRLDNISMRAYDNSPEQDPDILFGQTLETIKESVGLLGGKGRVIAIGLSGQMHGAVLYDDRGKLISPIINWKDRKWGSEVVIGKINHLLSDQSLDELGAGISSGYSAAILIGIKEMDPDLFQRVAHFLLPVDFLRGKLLGKNSFGTDPTNACGTGLFNTKLNCWHTGLIDKLGLPQKIFPDLHDTGDIAGRLSGDISRLNGLDAGCPVIYGGGDNQMSMLGCGLVDSDSPILLNIGTGSQISKVASFFQRFPGLDTRSYIHGLFAFVGASLAGGGSYRWLQHEIKDSKGVDLEFSQMDALASQVSPGADGLVFCSGSTRRNVQRQRGFFGNISMAGSIGHRARAVMEGILMDLYDAYEILGKNTSAEFIVGSGKGLQNSRVWSKISADLFGKSLRITGYESAVFGAALMAALGVGAIDNLDELPSSIIYSTETIPEISPHEFLSE